MGDEHKLASPVAQRLRANGFVPMPSWWVTPAELEIISRITKHNLPTVLKVEEEIWQEQALAEIEENYKHDWSYDE